MSARRDGVVLVVALLALLALGTITTSLLFLSTQEVRIARSAETTLRARLAAESAVRAALAGWSTRRVRDLGLGDARELERAAGVRATAVVERLAGRLFLVTAEADAPDGARAAAAALVRVPGIDELLRSFPAALTTNGAVDLEAGAVVSAAALERPPRPWPEEACPADALVALVEAFGGSGMPDVLRAGGEESGGDGAAGGGDAAAETAPPAGGVGPLGIDDLRAVADRIEPGTTALVPAPRTRDGGCDRAAPGNWGAPLEPDAPCGDYMPLIFAPGDLRVAGGSGQGILVVAGDLVLSGDARFYGPVLVLGELVARDRAAVFGAVATGGAGTNRIEGEAEIRYNACAIWRALTSAPALDRPFAPAGRLWIPLPARGGGE